MAFDAYILCTAPRSGSTMLCRMLEDTRVAGRPESYFHQPSLDAWRDAYDIAPGLDHAQTLRAVIAAVQAQGTTDAECFGLRLQRDSAAYFFDQLRVLLPQAADDHARIKAVFGRTAFIHLTRADKTAQAASFIRARQSGLWHRHADGSELERLSDARDAAYDRAEIATQIARFQQLDRAWQDWFAAQHIAPLHVTYEDLAANPNAVLRVCLTHLEQNPDRAAHARPSTAKLADEISAEWIARFNSGA